MTPQVLCYNAIAALLLANPEGVEAQDIYRQAGFDALLIEEVLRDMVARSIIRRCWTNLWPRDILYVWVG